MKPVEDLGTSNWKEGDEGISRTFGECTVLEVSPYWLRVRVKRAKGVPQKLVGPKKDEVWIPDDSLSPITHEHTIDRDSGGQAPNSSTNPNNRRDARSSARTAKAKRGGNAA